MQAALQYLRDYMLEHSGVALGADKDYLIHSRLHTVQQAHGLADLPALVQALQGAQATLLGPAVVSALTTHETSWFRDRRPFERLRTEIVPRWLEGSRRTLALWSAACSTGQEPYSIAMLLQEAGLCAPEWQIRLLASDICDDVLARARDGRFEALDMERGLPEELRRRYFDEQGGQWQVRPALARSVHFEHINLVALGPAPPQFDLIFCRNVLIYFDRPTQRKVLQALHARLLPGGLLFLGSSESPLGLCEGLRPWGQGSGIYERDPLAVAA